LDLRSISFGLIPMGRFRSEGLGKVWGAGVLLAATHL